MQSRACGKAAQTFSHRVDGIHAAGRMRVSGLGHSSSSSHPARGDPASAKRKAVKIECCRTPDPISTRTAPPSPTASRPTPHHSVALRGPCGLSPISGEAPGGEASCSVHPSISPGHSSSSSNLCCCTGPLTPTTGLKTNPCAWHSPCSFER